MADDLYRKMVVQNVTAEQAKVFKYPSVGTVLSVTSYEPGTKAMIVAYAMSEDTKAADQVAIQDAISAAITAACGKGYDVFETIQKGEKLTTAADALK